MSVIAAPQLADCVAEDWPEYDHAVSGAATRARQVHDQSLTRDTSNATAQHRCRHTMINSILSDRGRELRDFALHHRPRLLRGLIMRSQSGAARGDHDRMTGGHRIPQRHTDRIPVRHYHGSRHLKTKIIKSGDDDRPRSILIDTRSSARRNSDHERTLAHDPASRVQSPLRPPDLDTTRTSLITAARSMALIMSITASPATATAVSASISTPVRSVVLTVAVISTPSSITSAATSTPLMK